MKRYLLITKNIFKDYWLFIIPSGSLFLLLGFVLIKVGFDYFFTESSGYYFYSSLLQANAAIISIFSIFFIYKVQSLQSSISDIFNSISSINPHAKDNAQKFKTMTLIQKKERLKEYNNNNAICMFYKQWYDMEIELIRIRKKIIGPSVLLIIAIIFEAVFLVLSNGIHIHGGMFEFLSYATNILYESFVLGLLVKTIFEITLNRSSDSEE